MSKFKVGDLVRWSLDRKPTIPTLDANKVYTITNVHERGYLDFYGVADKQWFPENFELCKNTIVKNILNDL